MDWREDEVYFYFTTVETRLLRLAGLPLDIDTAVENNVVARLLLRAEALSSFDVLAIELRYVAPLERKGDDRHTHLPCARPTLVTSCTSRCLRHAIPVSSIYRKRWISDYHLQH